LSTLKESLEEKVKELTANQEILIAKVSSLENRDRPRSQYQRPTEHTDSEESPEPVGRPACISAKREMPVLHTAVLVNPRAQQEAWKQEFPGSTG
jgi:hypothetical protein